MYSIDTKQLGFVKNDGVISVIDQEKLREVTSPHAKCRCEDASVLVMRVPHLADLPHWQRHIVRAVKELTPFVHTDARFNKKLARNIRRYLPYVVHTTDIAKTHVFLNRNYKPIGCETTDWVDYDHYPSAHISQAELLRVIPFFSYHQQAYHIEGRFFQDDNCPWTSKQHAQGLMIRLVRLLASRHKVSEREVIRYVGSVA